MTPEGVKSRLTGYNGTTYTYDENGNIITRTDGGGTTTYEYDSENQLIRITDPESRVTTYTYDGLGRRIEKNANGTITRYVYDLEDILFEYDGLNNITARYTHGPGIEDPIAMDRGGESYFYHSDGLGSITQITDSAKQTIASYTYDAFGNITSQTGSLTNPYTYTGREYDSESGLYYYRARYYDPKIGRFLQPNPLDMATVILIGEYLPGSPVSELLYQYALTRPQSISNLYPYVVNNPVNWIDPWGLIRAVFNAGGHIWLPPTAGSFGINLSSEWWGLSFYKNEFKGMSKEFVIGSLWDVGVSAGISGFGGCKEGRKRTLAFGVGKYFGFQFTFKGGSLDAITAGWGRGRSLPVTFTIPWEELLSRF